MQRFATSSIALLTMLFSTLLIASSSPALEKRSVPAPDRADEWNAGVLCTVSYYNYCTAWVWAWSNFSGSSRLGTVFATCDDPLGATLIESSILVAYSAPPGYDYTGTIAVHNVDANDCPVGAAIASQPFLPTSGTDVRQWGIAVPGEFAIVLTIEAPFGGPNPGGFATDHPAAGPTGPQACGSCYPANRAIHSFYYGTAANPFCPGYTFSDGVCDAELIWDATMTAGPLALEPSSWGSIKAIYR